MSPDSLSEYRYHLTTEEFVFAVTADDESFAKRADEMSKKGVERLTGNDIYKIHHLTHIIFPFQLTYILLHETRVDGYPIMLANIDEPMPSLLIYKSSIPNLFLNNCQLCQLEGKRLLPSATNFYIFQSIIGNFKIDSSTTGDFKIVSSITGDFRIVNKSTTGEFRIKSKSTTGDFNIDQSKIGRFRIQDQSATGEFYISQSNTSYFEIEQSNTGEFRIVNQSETGDFDIDQSITGEFSVDQSIAGHFAIRNQSMTGDFHIGKSATLGFRILNQSTTGHIMIYESTTEGFFVAHSVTGNFNIRQSATGDLSIDQNTTANLTIDQSTIGDLRILNQTTTGYIYIDKSTTGDFYIIHSSIGNFDISQSTTGDLYIKNSNALNFTGSDLYNSLFLQKATITDLRLINCHLPSLTIGSSCKAEIYITDSTFNLIDLRHLTLGKESVISLFNCSIYVCLMEGFTVLGNLLFRQSQVLSVPFIWYNPAERIGNKPDSDNVLALTIYSAAVALLNLHSESYNKHITWLTNNEMEHDSGKKGMAISTPTLRISQSSLGKTEFTDCDLRKFRFEYNSAKITEVFMSGGTVPEAGINIYNATSEDGKEEDSLKREEQKVSVYNQLKKIFEAQGDIYWSTHFQSKTAEHQTEVLKIRREKEKEWFGTTFWDLFTLRLNAISNNHGESWGQAIVFTFVGAAVAFATYLWTIGLLFNMHSPVDWDLVGQYFNFLDPTHKDDFIKDSNQNFVSRFIHFLGRIWVGYGIFQFISSAFRKHGKK